MSAGRQNILITAGSGNIGKELLKLLSERKPASIGKIVLPTTSRERLLSTLPPSAASILPLVIAEGSISDAFFLEDLLRTHDVDSVLLNLTGNDELMVAMNTLDALARVKSVKHLVYISAAGDFSPNAVLNGALKNVDSGIMSIKFLTEQKLAYGALPYTSTVLGPTLFFSNDFRFKAGLTKSDAEGGPIFECPFPVTRGVSRVDVRDIAIGALHSLLDQGKHWAGKKVTIGTRKVYTSAELGRIWSEALGKKVTMLDNSDETMATYEKKTVAAGGNPVFARTMFVMFKNYFSQTFYEQSEQEYKDQVELLGKEPTDYEAWVKKVGVTGIRS